MALNSSCFYFYCVATLPHIFLFFEIGSNSIAQADLKFMLDLLFMPSQFQNCRVSHHIHPNSDLQACAPGRLWSPPDVL